jgi:hypothetical protein
VAIARGRAITCATPFKSYDAIVTLGESVEKLLVVADITSRKRTGGVMTQTFYSVLGVGPDADADAVERAYRE